MAERSIVWTRTADIQFVQVLEFWLKKNKSNKYPKRLIELVTERTSQIKETPFMYKLTDFSDVRMAAMGNFSIYYKVTDDSIIISAFWDNRQNPKKLIKVLQGE